LQIFSIAAAADAAAPSVFFLSALACFALYGSSSFFVLSFACCNLRAFVVFGWGVLLFSFLSLTC
jgi:hypothetical protein